MGQRMDAALVELSKFLHSKALTWVDGEPTVCDCGQDHDSDEAILAHFLFEGRMPSYKDITDLLKCSVDEGFTFVTKMNGEGPDWSFSSLGTKEAVLIGTARSNSDGDNAWMEQTVTFHPGAFLVMQEITDEWHGVHSRITRDQTHIRFCDPYLKNLLMKCVAAKEEEDKETQKLLN